MPYVGGTYEAAVRYGEEALTGYLETLTKHGDPIPRFPKPVKDHNPTLVCRSSFRTRGFLPLGLLNRIRSPLLPAHCAVRDYGCTKDEFVTGELIGSFPGYCCHAPHALRTRGLDSKQ